MSDVKFWQLGTRTRVFYEDKWEEGCMVEGFPRADGVFVRKTYVTKEDYDALLAERDALLAKTMPTDQQFNGRHIFSYIDGELRCVFCGNWVGSARCAGALRSGTMRK